MLARLDVPGMRNIALTSLDLDLVDLPASRKRQQSSAGDVCVSPVCEAQLDVVLWFQLQSMTSPRKQCLPLTDDPVVSSIHVDRDDARYGRLCGDERGDGARGRHFLVEEWDADGGSLEGLEEGEG